jgi:hypothetical protein
MSDATFPCPTCGVSLPARAKFCAECGTSVKAAAARTAAPAPAPGARPSAILPWFIAGVGVVAVAAMAIIMALRPAAGGGPSAAAAPFAGGGGPGDRATTDLSQMTPRQAADRLYDRVARASEAGDTAQVQFFGPMTIQAYQGVTPVDADVRLHIGMTQLALGNLDGAAAEADSLVRDSRTHLFGPYLKAHIAQARRNAAAEKAAWQTFLANFDAERAKNLPEYEQHATALTGAKATAQQVTGRR